MSKIARQQQADSAADAYSIRAIAKPNDAPISIGGNYHKTLVVHDSRSTGCQGTVYQNVRTNEIIVARRGTGSPKTDWFDAYTDWDVVVKSINHQVTESEKLTRQTMMLADVFH